MVLDGGKVGSKLPSRDSVAGVHASIIHSGSECKTQNLFVWKHLSSGF